jgi:hypothetical protein
MNEQEHFDLPWLINHSLDAAQRQQLETRLTQDKPLKLEADYLQQLRQHIKKSASPSPGALGWQRLQRELNTAKPASPRRIALALAAAVLLLVQGGVIIHLLQTATPESDYVPLSAPQSARADATLQIQFQPGISEQQMRELLIALDAQISSGPNANGLYRITIFDPALRNEKLQLAQQSKLVRFVAME